MRKLLQFGYLKKYIYAENVIKNRRLGLIFFIASFAPLLRIPEQKWNSNNPKFKKFLFFHACALITELAKLKQCQQETNRPPIWYILLVIYCVCTVNTKAFKIESVLDVLCWRYLLLISHLTFWKFCINLSHAPLTLNAYSWHWPNLHTLRDKKATFRRN